MAGEAWHSNIVTDPDVAVQVTSPAYVLILNYAAALVCLILDVSQIAGSAKLVGVLGIAPEIKARTVTILLSCSTKRRPYSCYAHKYSLLTH
jgi:hypothetical protein